MYTHAHTNTHIPTYPWSGISLSLPGILICTPSVARPRNTTQAPKVQTGCYQNPVFEKLRGGDGTDMVEPLDSHRVHWALLTLHLTILPPSEYEFNLRQVLSTWGERWTSATQATSSWFAIQKGGSLGLLASTVSNLRETRTPSPRTEGRHQIWLCPLLKTLPQIPTIYPHHRRKVTVHLALWWPYHYLCTSSSLYSPLSPNLSTWETPVFIIPNPPQTQSPSGHTGNPTKNPFCPSSSAPPL